ncbi:hypothetical protein ACFFU9_03480 [Mariniflexile ostreae]|uniref:YtkA-like protein n=1 Tax=Mariniflexile ostreae TaxID=1520892 RepID=A0ABV5F8M6_9FLAO
MNQNIFFIIAILFAVTSCTVDKTDYEAEISTEVTEHFEFTEVLSIDKGEFEIRIEALNGTFYKGYNDIRLKIINTQTNAIINASEVTFLPIMTTTTGNTVSCPHSYNLEYRSENSYYSGYAVFVSESNSSSHWELYLSFTVNNQKHTVTQHVSVAEQANKNLGMTMFTGHDNEQYIIALIAPQKPKIAENELVAGIYKYNQAQNESETFPDPSQFSYSEADGYTLLLDPRMPEPSMGNHSSLHNQDLTQQSDGLYYGVVNYTMTGNWTLNFMLQDQNAQLVKGTAVSTDFTPGIEGEKSELYIDILF